MEVQNEGFTQEELNRIQDEILGNAVESEKVSMDETKLPSQPKPIPPPPPPRSRKQSIMDSISKLRETMGLDGHSANYFHKRTIAVLERELVELTQQAQELHISGKPKEESNSAELEQEFDEADFLDVEEDGWSDAEMELPKVPKLNTPELGNALIQLNRMMAMTAEKLSLNFEDRLQTSLDGWTEELDKNEDALREVLLEIYSEHYEPLSKYLTPMSRYMMIMGMTATGKLAGNFRRPQQEE